MLGAGWMCARPAHFSETRPLRPSLGNRSILYGPTLLPPEPGAGWGGAGGEGFGPQVHIPIGARLSKAETQPPECGALCASAFKTITFPFL